jgi:hypothetical protein
LLDIVAHRHTSSIDHSAPSSHNLLAIDSLDPAELDRLMADRAIQVPQSWENWNLTTKIAWLKSQFENAPGATASVNFVAEQPASARGKSKVSLMAALAALAHPIQGEIVASGASDDATGFPAEAGAADPLRRVIDEIDGLDEQEALAAVGKLTRQSEAALFRLGGVLARLETRGWRKAYPSFKAFVEAEHEISHRAARRWMALYRRLADSGINWEQAQTIGWGKLQEIAGVLTRDNVEEWIVLASQNTTPRLIRIVAARKKAGAQLGIEHKPAAVMTRMSFRLHAGQRGAVQAAIEKAKAQAGAQAPAAALEAICANYVSGETLQHEAKAMGLEACLRVIEAAYPNAKLKVAFVEDEPQAA